MKILQLQFRNLNSLMGDFKIDFASGPLAEAGIFAITGATGAGKTTILDAITLALFGKAARYDNLSSPEAMMSRGSSDCFAEVLFECGEGCFSSRWDLRRANGNPDGKLQPPKRQLADSDGNILESKLRNVDERIVELTGLDYARFLRSVLLAQGRFREFLDAKPNERSELLERITGSEIYSRLGTLAYQTAQEKQHEIDLAQHTIEGLKLLDDEQLQKFDNERQALREQSKQNREKIEQLRHQLERYQQQKELKKQQEKLRQKQQQLQDYSFNLTPHLQKLEIHDHAAPLALDLQQLEKLTEQEEEILQQQKQLQERMQQARIENRRSLTLAHLACEQQRNQAAMQSLQLSQEHSSLNEHLDDIEKWMEGHISDLEIEKRLPEIRQQGEQCRSLQRQQEETLAAIQQNQKNLTERKAALSNLQSQLSQDQGREQELQLQLDGQRAILTQNQASHTRTSWQLQVDLLHNKQQVLSELSHLEDDYRLLNKAESELQKELKDLQAKLGVADTNFKALQQDLLRERRTLDDKTTLHQQALAIQSLSSHREHLLDGVPCPLCGALEHPYANSTLPTEPATQKALELQKQRAKSAEESARAAENNFTQLQSDYNNKSLQLHKNQADSKSLAARFKEKADQIELQIRIEERERLNQELTEVRDLLATAKMRAKELEKIEKEHTQVEREYLLFAAQQKSLQEQIKQRELELELTQRDLEQRQQSLKQLTEDQQNALSVFNQSISRWTSPVYGSDQTQEAIDNLELRLKYRREQDLQKSKLIQDQQNIKTRSEQVSQQLSRLLQEDEEWQRQLNQFDDIHLPQPTEVEITLSNEDNRNKLVSKAHTELTEVSALHDANLQSLHNQQQKLKAQQQQLEERLQDYGFISIKHLRQSLLSQEEAKSLRQKQTRLSEQQSKLDALWESNEQAMQKMLDYNLPQGEAANQLKLDYEQRLQEQTQLAERNGEINARLKEDHNRRISQKEKLQQITQLTQEAQQWFVLNDLIGSANGNKFSKFAQSLTLNQLIRLANFHLNALNPRYRIQLRSTEELALEVVDRHQADTVRPTSSLSGGESFLVSLALALGLSELAGRKTRIDSLFIDEGFGSLDAQTLDIAINALENLRLDSRTIGIISHVETLKSRLGTQIQVRRKGDGFSRLAVVDTH